MNAPAPALIDTAALTQESQQELTVARDFRIATSEQYEAAGARLKGIKALTAKIAQTFDPHIARAHAAHKALVAEKNDATAPLMQAETILKRCMIGFQQDQERIRREAEAKAREAADRERQKLEKQAAKLDEKGKGEQAEERRTQAAMIPTPVVEVRTPTVSGISTKETWTFEIVDAALIPREYLAVDERRIGGVVRSLKSATNIPGVRVFTTTTIASRAS